ncbi:MAG TPA: zinc-binding alcohol dehydrogenase family protein [Nitrospiraceae bacterium]|nr:zinc-binding alcohol dehydrogenase family protein [Nitrospiraceae bacterium]
MRAWLMDGYDGVDALRLSDVPDPKPGPGQILLRVGFAALNPADAFLARGMYPAHPPLPHILGRDGVGEVVAVGHEVARVGIGDIVGILRCQVGVETWGTLAEKVVVPEESVTAVPNGWSSEEMAGAPLVFLTAWQALTQWNDPPQPPRPGSVLLVTGASGGVGVASVLLGKSMDLIVIGLSRSAQKVDALKSLGVAHVFDSTDSQWVKNMTSAIAPRKVDLAVDNVGGSLFQDVVATLGYGGRVSVVGRSGGLVPQFNTATLFFRRIRIGGVSVGDYTPEDAQAAWSQITARLDTLHRRPIVDSVVAFDEVKAGFARLSRGPLGKVLVRVAN